MKICIVVGCFPALSETFIVTKVLGLLDRGVNVEIVSHGKSSDWKRFQVLENRLDIRYRTHIIPSHKSKLRAAMGAPFILLWKAIGSPIDFSRYLIYYLKKFGISTKSIKQLYLKVPFMGKRFDIIHFEFGPYAVAHIDVKEIMGCKIICSFRGYDLDYHRLENPNFYNGVFEKSDCLHIISEHLRRQALRRGCPSDVPYVLIPPAIDTDLFNRQKLYSSNTDHRPLRLLTVARLHWKKGYEYALEAIRNVINSGYLIEYMIIGRGDYEEAVRFAIDQMQLSGVVKLVGPVDREEVRKYYEWADILVHSAIEEGFCNAVLEAQAMQVPVVTTDAGGLPENVQDGVTGFVVPRRNAKAMAEKIKLLADNPKLRYCMGRAGRKRVVERFRIEDQVRNFYEFYCKLLEDKITGENIS